MSALILYGDSERNPGALAVHGQHERVADRDWQLVAQRTLIAGDVIAVEPGLWQRDVGGVRFEDLLQITEDGAPRADRFPVRHTPGSGPGAATVGKPWGSRPAKPR